MGGNETMSQDDFWTHLSNVNIWLDSALGYQESCLQVFLDFGLNGEIQAARRPRIDYADQMIDNAKAFISLFGSEYCASNNFIASFFFVGKLHCILMQCHWLFFAVSPDSFGLFYPTPPKH